MSAALPLGRVLAPVTTLGTVRPMTAPIAQPLTPPRRRKLGELLVDAGLIDEIQLKSALSEQRKWGGRLGRTLVEMGFLTEDAMVRALSSQLQVPVANLEGVTAEAVKLLRGDAAERYGIFPVGGDEKAKVLVIASSDPTNQEMLKELAFATGMKIQVQVAASTAIDRAIRRHYYGETAPVQPELSGPAANAPAFGGNDLVLDLLDLPLQEKPRDAELEAKVAELTRKVSELENALATQARGMRILMELLLDKGTVTREEYLAKVRVAK